MNLTHLKNLAISALMVCASAAAHSGELFADSVKSSALGRDIKFTVYLPDGYKDANKKFPVIYLLHGDSGDEVEWARKGGAVETFDGLIKRGLMRPSIAVMPTAGSTWWADGAAEKVETEIGRAHV